MDKSIYFKTAMFDVLQEQKNPFNSVYGISLLSWLKEELKDIVLISEPDAEDWGWYSELDWDGNKYLIGAIAFLDPKGALRVVLD